MYTQGIIWRLKKENVFKVKILECYYVKVDVIFMTIMV